MIDRCKAMSTVFESARIHPDLLEQLIRIHQVNETLETLAFLIDFLILAPIEQLFLDFIEKLVLVVHEIVFLAASSLVIAIEPVFLIRHENAIEKLLERACVVLLLLLEVWRGHSAQILFQRLQDVLEASQV